MRGWLPIERRFLSALMDGVLPAAAIGPQGGDPVFWAEFERASPPLLRLALRAAAWLFGSWIGLLSPDRRDRWLNQLARSRFYLVRQLILSVKLVVCFAHFSRERGHEHPVS